MFIHWGPVSLTGHEIGWSHGRQTPVEKYDNLYKKFNPTQFNADEWVAVAKAAGMKYVVLTNYGPLFTLWYDVPQKFNAERGQGVIDMAHAIQPDIVNNNRTGAKTDFAPGTKP